MTGLECVLIGALAAALVLAFRSKNVADHTAQFRSIDAAHAYIQRQDEAGYDCFIRRTGAGWEVRCYRRQEPSA
ncbi:hypothetical protein [Xanthomonas citri]|uniref:hypothetical protein n=1 Tax=Xanthomonas citri TaxID=346 RepID=UPI0002FE1CDD|nr:hypothetical protein [Xanthomonas citri]AMV00078.1 hypothetical protein TP37_19860 [Xanthomonas citri pv. aurantifolii]AMV02096.1 hypothetical protein TP50_06275 [Xanthomonas citri pv. aurantifolii]MCC8490855.1 hypothetical protein [Xanthomonas citri pv. fuscans]TBW97970.1 hypothetical protein TP47_09595 [Xanthomonas citri pv. aurantifolii]TBW99286.1 hypothetical protein TP49_04455 [Xanthomonas citri pv. aurantifolii]